ncbi:MAG TPA: hypothetical protein DCY40_06965 [Actinobacteria bacterium]|nr:hypothetical protein [Actinomycetota bacterium]
MTPRTPARDRFTSAEQRLIDTLRTPRQVQRFLREFPYNWEKTLRTFRGVVDRGRAHCLEAVLFAATVLEQHGYPALALDLESHDGLDHVLFIYQDDALWGTVARSRDEGLHGRKPVFKSVRALVDSYMDPYVDGSGRLKGFTVAHLDDLTRRDWRLGTINVWSVEEALRHWPHQTIRMGEARYQRALQRVLAIKASNPEMSPRLWRGLLRDQTGTWL